VDSTNVIENPTEGEIAEALTVAKFAVLANAPDSSTYMQFARCRKRGIELEYQVDSLENHFRASDLLPTMERVVAAFQQYASRDDSWKTDFQWERLDLMTIGGQKLLITREWMRSLTKPPAES
jgi:hypothetical protein